jgi:hypothetical protein
MYQNVLNVCKIFKEVQRGKNTTLEANVDWRLILKFILKYKERLDPIFSLLRTWYSGDLLWPH